MRQQTQRLVAQRRGGRANARAGEGRGDAPSGRGVGLVEGHAEELA